MAVGLWGVQELADLRRLASEGASGPEIASRLGRSTGAVQQKALELGIELMRVDQTGWRRGEPASPAGDGAGCPSEKQAPDGRRRPM